MIKSIPKFIPLALLMATAYPAMAQAQETPIIEVAPRHGHTFYFENEDAVVVHAWPGAFDAFDYGERPKIPSARFIYVNLKPKSDIDSTTLTVVYRIGGGKEKTKTFLLKKTNSPPNKFRTAIDGSPAAVAAQPQPVQPVVAPEISTPSPQSDKQLPKEKNGKKPKQLKVSSEFSGAPSPGIKDPKVDEPIPAKEVEQPQSEQSEEPDIPDPVKSKPKRQAGKPQSDELPLIRAPKMPQSTATVETPSKTQLIERSSLNEFQIASHLLKGLYGAERKKQINPRKPQFKQAHSMARLLRDGHSVDKSLQLSGLPPETFENLLGHGGVGK